MSMQNTSTRQPEPPGSEVVPEQIVEAIQPPVEREERAEETPFIRQAPPVYIPPAQPPYRAPVGTPGAYPSWQAGYRPPRKSLARNVWFWIGLSLILVLLIAGGVTALVVPLGGNLAYTSQVATTHTYTVSGQPTLVINNDIGNIRVQAGGDGNTITIQETKYTGVGADQNDLVVRYGQDSANNTVTVNVTRTTNFNLFNSPRADFDVTVPAASDLTIKTNTGGIDVSGVSGQILLGSNTGSVTATSGTLSGNSMLSSNTGSITFNGSIATSGNYTFQTNTGSVKVNLPGDTTFRVDATTDTGSISTNFPGLTVERPNYTGAQLHGTVGTSPTTTLLLKTNTGSITLNQR